MLLKVRNNQCPSVDSFVDPSSTSTLQSDDDALSNDNKDDNKDDDNTLLATFLSKMLTMTEPSPPTIQMESPLLLHPVPNLPFSISHVSPSLPQMSLNNDNNLWSGVSMNGSPAHSVGFSSRS